MSRPDIRLEKACQPEGGERGPGRRLAELPLLPHQGVQAVLGSNICFGSDLIFFYSLKVSRRDLFLVPYERTGYPNCWISARPFYNTEFDIRQDTGYLV